MSDFTDITTIPPVCVVTTGDEDSLKRFHVPVNGTAKDGISVLLERSDNGVRIYLTADDTPVSWVRLTFPAEFHIFPGLYSTGEKNRTDFFGIRSSGIRTSNVQSSFSKTADSHTRIISHFPPVVNYKSCYCDETRKFSAFRAIYVII